MIIDIIVLTLVCILVLLVSFYLFVFARNPSRNVPSTPNVIISPTDGRVSHIIQANDTNVRVSKGALGAIDTACSDVADECIILSIMMTPLDVHYQRAPIAGTIKSINYRRGAFANAVTNTSEPLLSNEHNSILIDNGNLRIKVIQIAGALAQRIRCFVNKDQRVKRGSHIGFIDLGSQVTMIMPSTVKVKVKKGDYVYGAETIIATTTQNK